MRKKVLAILSVPFLLLSLSGCFNHYKITYDPEEVFNCPKSAKAGEIVTFETLIVCDADLYAYLNGVELNPVREGYYEFIMPAADVSIDIVIVSNGLA